MANIANPLQLDFYALKAPFRLLHHSSVVLAGYTVYSMVLGISIVQQARLASKPDNGGSLDG